MQNLEHPAVLLLSWGEQMAGDGGEMVGEGQVWSQSAGVHCSLHLALSCSAVGTLSTLPTLNPTNTRLVACVLSIYSLT